LKITIFRLILFFTAFIEKQFCWFSCHSNEGGIS